MRSDAEPPTAIYPRRSRDIKVLEHGGQISAFCAGACDVFCPEITGAAVGDAPKSPLSTATLERLSDSNAVARW